MTQTASTVVRKEIVVEAPVERAFAVFTERIGDFKPPEHHLLRVPIAATVFEPRVGGHGHRPWRGRQRMPVGQRPRVRPAAPGGVQLEHRTELADRSRPGQPKRGGGHLHAAWPGSDSR